MRTVLLVEDQTQVRKVIHRMLERAGYRVIPAASAPEALSLERTHGGPIDIVLTDVVLPGISGPELVLRINKRRIGTRTLFMSGYPDEVVVRRLGATFPCRLLQKPFDWRALAESLTELFGEPQPEHAHG